VTRQSVETFVPKRPLPASSGKLGGVGGEGMGEVTVDDAALFLGRFTGGPLGTFEATRLDLGRKNAIRIQVNGSAGSLAFDFEDMNVVEFFDGAEPAGTAGFRRIVVTEPQHPCTAAWWPAGHGLGYEHGSPTRSSTWSPRWPRATNPPRRTPTDWRSSTFSTRSSAAPPTAPPGPTSPADEGPRPPRPSHARGGARDMATRSP
jgi:hypothetical protein